MKTYHAQYDTLKGVSYGRDGRAMSMTPARWAENGLNLSRSTNIVNMGNMRNRRGHTIAGTFVKGEI